MIDLQSSRDECKTCQSRNDPQYSYCNWYPNKCNLHFCSEFGLKFESNQVYLMDAIILMYYQHLADRRVCWVAIETKLSCLNGLIKGLRRKHTQKGILWMLKGVRKPTLCSKCLCSHKFIYRVKPEFHSFSILRSKIQLETSQAEET